MDFKFKMGATVRTKLGTEGDITVRIENQFGLSYRIQCNDGIEREVKEKDLWLVSCVPTWLRPGAEVQWMGEGLHEKYVVKELCRGGRYRPRAFGAERELFRPNGTSIGRERMFTECTPANMAFWRPWKEKKKSANRPGRRVKGSRKEIG